MKHETICVKATVQSDLYVYGHRHHVSFFIIDKFLYILHSAGSQPRCSSPSELQFFHILYWRVVDSFLHHSPNAVINPLNAWAVDWPHVGGNEFRFLMTKQLTDVHDESVYFPAEM